MSKNLMDGLLSEINRVKKIIIEYEDPALKGSGNLAAFLMKHEVANAKKAISDNDIVGMMQSYNALKEYEL